MLSSAAAAAADPAAVAPRLRCSGADGGGGFRRAAGRSGLLKAAEELGSEALNPGVALPLAADGARTGVLVHAGEKNAGDREDANVVRKSGAPPVAYRQAWMERSRMAAAALAAFCFFSASLSEQRNRRMSGYGRACIMRKVLCKFFLKLIIFERIFSFTGFFLLKKSLYREISFNALVALIIVFLLRCEFLCFLFECILIKIDMFLRFILCSESPDK